MLPFIKSRLFYKYLLSYFIVLLIPILVLFFMVYTSLIQMMNDEISNKNMEMLLQAKTSIDSQIQQLLKVSYQIQENRYLSRSIIAGDIVDSRNALSIIKNYSAVTLFAQEILLYHHGEPYFYSSSGTYSPSSFFSQICRYEQFGEPSFFQAANNVSDVTVWPAQTVTSYNTTQERIVTFLVNLPYMSLDKKTTVIYQIPEKKIVNFFKGISDGSSGNVFIIDNKKNIITSLHYNTPKSFSEIIKLIDTNEPVSNKHIDIEGNSFIVSAIPSDAMPWRYISILPNNSASPSIAFITARAFYSLILVIISGSLIIYGIMCINYNPLKKLKQFTDEKLGNIRNLDEISSIKSAVEHLYTTSRVIQDHLEDSRDAIKASLLAGLVNGQYHSLNSFNLKAEKIGIHIKAPCFAVIVISVNKTHSVNEIDFSSLISFVQNILSHYIEAHGFKSSNEDNTIVFILGLLGEGEYELLDTMLIDVKRLLAEKFLAKVSIGIGNCCFQTSDLRKSYNEALTAVNHRLTKGEDCIIFYSAICDLSASSMRYPKEELEKLQLYILQADDEKSAGAVRNIIQIIEENKMPLFLARTLCFDIISTVIKTLDSLYTEFPGIKSEFGKLEKLMEFETVGELSQLLSSFISEVCMYMRENRLKNADGRIELLKEYIQNNFMDYNFSARLMADYFNLSVSNLSHFFKSKTGQSISDYVNNLRIEEAKRLLASSDENVQSIVSQIGYINVSSFIRRFRQETGLTPGGYRELHG